MAGFRLVAFLFLFAVFSTAQSATFPVNSTLDEPDGSAGDGKCETVPGNGVCTLRAAVLEASAITSTPHKIIVPAGIYLLKPFSREVSVELRPAGQISIEGAGIGKTIIDATDLRDNVNGSAARNQYPVFWVGGAATILSLSRLTIQNSHYEGGGTIGAIFISGALLNLSEVALVNNTGVATSAAIANYLGTITVRDSLFLNNSAPNCGALSSIGIATISNSTFVGNKATAGPGGAICTVFTNVSRDALVSDRMSITNTTFYGNSAATQGGAIYAGTFPATGTVGLQLLNVTFDSNSAPFGASIGWDLVGANNALVSAENTIFSNSLGGGENCIRGGASQFISRGHNISSDSSCPFDQSGDLVNTDPLLGPLADNGGLTQTQALLGGSPAIDAGSKNCTVFDQRGTVRPIDGNKDGKAVCDVGAVEAPPGLISSFAAFNSRPSSGGIGGEVSISIRGSGFTSPVIVRLVQNGVTVIEGKDTVVESEGKIVSHLDLTRVPPGDCTLVVINADGVQATLSEPFAIVSPIPNRPRIQLIAPPVVRRGNSTKAWVVITNDSNIDQEYVVQVTGTTSGAQAVQQRATPSAAKTNVIRLPVGTSRTDVYTSGAIERCAPIEVRSACAAEREKYERARQDYSNAFRDWILALAKSKFNYTTIAACAKLPAMCVSLAADLLTSVYLNLTTTEFNMISAQQEYRLCLLKHAGGIEIAGPADAATTIRPVASYDPNDKFGDVGSGAQRFVNGALGAPYVVQFENKPEATAAAQTVVITDVIDSTKFDLSTFTLGPITFGDKVVDVPSGEQQFVTAVDLRPANNLIVRIDAGIDLVTSIATWRFESIDPITGLPTTDPTAGFLPPNKTSPEGQGSVLFTVQAKSGLASGTTISNKASIVFDTNDPIETPIWSNTIDLSSPSSAIEALAATQATNSFIVKWAGTDIDSGMRDYTIFVGVDGGTPTPWLVDTTETSATYTGEVGKTYAFYSVARDNVSNVESAPAAPDATTKVAQASAGGSSGGGGGGGCTTSGNARLDLSFGLLFFLAWRARHSNRKTQRERN